MNVAPGEQPSRLIKLRFAGKCRECGAALSPGEHAFHLKDAKAVVCEGCMDAPQSDRPAQQAGDQLQREFHRRSAIRQDQNLERFGASLGKVVNLVTSEPATTKAFKKGAEGERSTQRMLEGSLKNTQCRVLHARRMPTGRGDIDHIVIGPAGVTVVDSKNHKGKVRARSVGPLWRQRTELWVNGRNQDKLIVGVQRQVTAVEKLLTTIQPPLAIPVTGAIRWVDVDGLPLFGAIDVSGVKVAHRKKLVAHLNRPGDFDQHQIAFVAEFLDGALNPA